MSTPAPATNPAAVSATIRRLRREKGMTQEALAQAIGVSPQAISKWETGQTMPDITLLLPLSKELGIGVNELLGGNRRQELEEKYQKACPLGSAYSLMVALEALEEFPDDETFLYRRACDELFIGKSNPIGAQRYIERAIMGLHYLCCKDPDWPTYRSMLAEAYLAQGDKDRAYAEALDYNGSEKERVMERFLDEETRHAKKQQALKNAVCNLYNALFSYGTPEAIKTAHTMLDSLLGDEQNLHDLGLRELSVKEALLCRDVGDDEGYARYLTKAYEEARAVDTLPPERIPYRTPLFDRLQYDHVPKPGVGNETYQFLMFHDSLFAHPAAEGLKRRMVDEVIRCRALHYDARNYLKFCEQQIGSPYHFNFSTAWDTTREETAAMEASLRYTHASLYRSIEWRVRNGELAERLVSEGTLTGVFAGYLDIMLAFCNCKEKSAYKRLPIPEEERAIPTAPEGSRILAIAELLISHNFRDCGLEEKLLDFVLTGAKKQGYTHVEAYPIEDCLPEMYDTRLAIYEKMGFSVIRDLSGGHFLHNEWDREGEKPYRRLYILQKEL